MSVTTDERAEKLAELKAITEAATADDRDLTAEESAELEAGLKSISEFDEKADKRKADSELKAQLDAAAALGATKTDGEKPSSEDIAGAVSKALQSLVPEVVDSPTGPQSAGKAVALSDEYKSMIDSFGGSIPERADARMMPVDVGGLKALLYTDEYAHATSAGPLMGPSDWRGLQSYRYQPLILRDLVTNLTTGSDQIQFARLGVNTNNADVVAESQDMTTAGRAAPGGVKPESDMAWTQDTLNVITVAHYIPVTTKALADIDQLRGLIDEFLVWGVAQKVESLILQGDSGATPPEFDGLMNTTGIATQPFVAADGIIGGVRKAITALLNNGYAPTAILMNPADAEALDVMRLDQGGGAGTGAYLSPGAPFGTAASTLWGLPRIISQSVPAGKAIVAEWRHAVLFDRQQTAITTGLINDQFIRNQLTVLCEARMGFGVMATPAFVIVDTA